MSENSQDKRLPIEFLDGLKSYLNKGIDDKEIVNHLFGICLEYLRSHKRGLRI